MYPNEKLARGPRRRQYRYVTILFVIFVIFIILFSMSGTPEGSSEILVVVQPQKGRLEEVKNKIFVQDRNIEIAGTESVQQLTIKQQQQEDRNIEIAGTESGQQQQKNNNQSEKSEKLEKSEKSEKSGNLDYSFRIPHVVIYDPPDEDPEIKKKRNAIREAFSHAYGGYEKKCFGAEEVKPISGECNDWLVKDMGLSILDSLDTMLIMNLPSFYLKAFDYIQYKIDWNKDIQVSVFETNIRCLGGLLAAYDMTKLPFLLQKAVDLGNRLLPAFNTSTGLPMTYVNLRNGKTSNPQWTNQASLLAEMGTLQIEFSFLSSLTNNSIYAKKVLAIYEKINEMLPEDKLLTVFINPHEGKSQGNDLVTVGGLGDSYYEYLLKFWLVTKKKNPKFGKMYFDIIESILHQLAIKVQISGEDMYYIAERHNGIVFHKFDHLACFFGGLLALGAQHAPTPEVKSKHMEIGLGIGRFCRAMYEANPTGLASDEVLINNGQIFPNGGASKGWVMRPEAVETWFILYRLTNDNKYRDWGWEYFLAIEKYSKKEFGYTGLRDVTQLDNLLPDDVQQSYFLAETLKYLFLLFSPPDVIPLDEFVFNTEAHPVSMFDLFE